jgi:DNA-binding response OmpR family regulator
LGAGANDFRMRGKRILVVEDDSDLGELLLHVLRSAGYSVDLARTVSQAERRFSEHGYELVVPDCDRPPRGGPGRMLV